MSLTQTPPRPSSASDARWPSDGNRARAVFVNANTGSDSNDGRAWSRAKKTIQGALNALSAKGGDVYVAAGSYVEAVSTTNSQRIIGVASGFSNQPTIYAPATDSVVVSVLHESCHIEGMQILGYQPPGQDPGVTFIGTLLYVDTLGGNSTFERLNMSQGAGVNTQIEGGTGISHGAEMCHYSDIALGKLQLAIRVRNEGTTSVFDLIRPGQCRQELLFEGNGGGLTFRNYKSFNGGQSEHAGGTDDFSHKVVQVNGNGNVFQHCDWSESHNVFHEVSGAHNFFYGCALAPASRMDVTGTWNKFDGYDLQGAMVVSGANNKLEGVWPHLADLTISDATTIVDWVREDQRPILGSVDFRRTVLSDELAAVRALTIARSALPSGASVPTDLEPAAWWKADALGLANADPVATWTDSSGNANSLSQATAGKRPTYRTNVINSKPVVRFDGTDDFLSLLGLPVPAAHYTLLAVTAMTGANGTAYTQRDPNAGNPIVAQLELVSSRWVLTERNDANALVRATTTGATIAITVT
jgi:hypothetical protein